MSALTVEEILGWRRLENRSAKLDDVAYTLCLELNYFSVDESFLATVHSFYFKTVVDGCSGDSSDGAVHARCIVAGSHDADTFDFCHVVLLSFCYPLNNEVIFVCSIHVMLSFDYVFVRHA